MTSNIYLLGDNGKLVTMAEEPYDSEALLQKLLADYPSLLAGDQINPTAPREWLLVRREAGIPSEDGGGDRWSVDHLFLDQDAIPTLVEVKRSSDTRIRREVIGQMLDYAANAVVHWPVERIRTAFETECQASGGDPETRVRQFSREGQDVELFWSDVKTNLQAGRVRLVFVADTIPAELSRVVEFLNEQMDPAEVLAVEIRQFVGEERRTLVPRVLGQTAQAQRRKGTSGGETRQWDETSFFTDLSSAHGETQTKVARDVLAWATAEDLRIWWGKGARIGSFFPLLDTDDTQHWTFAVWTNGGIEIQFQHMKTREPFVAEELRRELCNKLNNIPGIQIPEDAIVRRPSISLEALTHDRVLDQFLQVFHWYLDQIRNLAPDGAESAGALAPKDVPV